MHSDITVVESQVDWLTLAVHTQPKNLELEHFAVELARDSEVSREKMRPFNLMGYKGWRCGRVRYGTRNAAGLVQLSGDLASRHLNTLYPLADHVSRIDLAVTVHAPALYSMMPRSHFHEAQSEAELRERAPLGKIVEDTRGGSTFYLGDRSSDTFLRVYNKQAECEAAHDDEGAEHYEGCVRYELELKGLAAKPMAGNLAVSEPRAPDVQQTVYHHAFSHGLTPAFGPSGGQALKTGFRRRSDLETRMRWLDKSVRPAITWLLAHADATEVLDSLGLADVMTDRRLESEQF